MPRSPKKKTPLSDDSGEGTPIEDRIRSGGSAYDMSPISPNVAASGSRDSWDDNENPDPAPAPAAAASPRTPEALSMEMSASPTLLEKFDAEAGHAKDLINTTVPSTDNAPVGAVGANKKSGTSNKYRRFAVVAGLVLLAGAGAALGLTLGRGGGGSSSMNTSGSISAENGAGDTAGTADGAPDAAPGDAEQADASESTSTTANDVGTPEEDADTADTTTTHPQEEEEEEEKVPPKPSRPPPNVVFIVLDDLGYADVGFTQPEGEGPAEVKMPNTDKLAKKGVIFTDGYSSGEVCAPTRAGFMLGRYQQGVGIYSAKSGGGDGMKLVDYNNETAQYEQVNPWIPHFLKQKTSGAEADVNYVTGAFGKWHLGTDDVFLTDADGIYRYQENTPNHDNTDYANKQRADGNLYFYPINGPMMNTNASAHVIDGIPDVYSSIAPLGQSGSPYHPLYRGFDAHHIFMGRGAKDYWDANDMYISMDEDKPRLAKTRRMDPRLNPGNAEYPLFDQEPFDTWNVDAANYTIHRDRIPSKYATVNFTNSAIDFIRKHAGGPQPFFAYIPYSAPHYPAQAPYHMDPETGALDRMGEDIRRYANMTREEFEASGIEDAWFDSSYDGDWFPDPVYLYEKYKDHERGFKNIYIEEDNVHDENATGYTCRECNDNDLRRRAITTAMNRWVDKGIGQIVNALKDPNGDGDTSDSVYEDTMIVFISDNGGAGKMRASNKPLRGGKFYMWEGGHRVPFFMTWDRFLSSAGKNGTDIRGTSVDEPVTSLDVLPTILDAGGINDPSSNPLLRSSPSDGKSWLPALDGSVTRLHDYLFWFRERAGNRYVGVVRRGRWKLIIDRKEGPGFELFNLKTDIGETNNMAQSYPDIVQELKGAFIKYANEMARRNGEEVPNVRLSRMSSV